LSTSGLSLSRRIDSVGLKLKLFILITMAHHDRSILERVIALAEEGGLSASTAGELYGFPNSAARAWLRKYWRDVQVGRRRGTGLWRVSDPAQDDALVAEAQRNPFVSARDLKAATGFPGQKNYAYFQTKGSRSPGTTRCGE
jgi:transposase-like protein